MFKIPFSIWPYSWGLKGKARKRAKAEYELEGYDLEIELAKIDIEDEKELLKKITLINKKYHKISEYDADLQLSTLEVTEETSQLLAELDIKLKHNRISKNDYEKERATLLKEPWISIPEVHWSPNNNSRAFFQIDYNEYFVDSLRDQGLIGTDDEIINQWMNLVCASILQEVDNENVNFIRNNYKTFVDDA